MINTILVVVFSWITVLCGWPFRKTPRGNPVLLFLFFNWVMGAGSLVLIDDTISADLWYAAIILVTPLAFSAGAMMEAQGAQLKVSYCEWLSASTVRETQRERRIMFVLMIVSVVVTIIYYSLVGYNLMLRSLTGEVDDFTSMRLAAYSGGAYYGAGYVNQFKNTLLPISIFFFGLTLRGGLRALFLLLAIPFCLYAVAGTGQRTFLVLTTILLVFTLSLTHKRKIPLGVYGAVGVLCILLFSLLSVKLGRIDGLSAYGAAVGFVRRVFVSNQLGSVVGFRVVFEEGVQWGEDWVRSFMGIFPGVAGSDIAYRIHAYLFGSSRGTVPLGIWASAYYNFGFLGPMVMAFIMGWWCCRLYKRYLKGRQSIYRTVSYAAVFAYLSTWVTGSPVQLLNNGLATCLILLLLPKLRVNSVWPKVGR